MTHEGGCLCGGVRLRAELAEGELHACHCSMCRRWNGGPGLAVMSAGVTFEGELAPAVYASSEWAERGFCPRCGSCLFYRMRETGQTMLSFGCLDDPGALHLASEIYIDAKSPAYAFAGEHPRLTEAEFIASLGAPPPAG